MFKDYIKSSAGPSTPTIGHCSCGLIYNFIDDCVPKRYSSKKELKIIATRFALKNGLHEVLLRRFLLDVDRLNSDGYFSDMEIFIRAFKMVMARGGED